jgi:hypothetical protein
LAALPPRVVAEGIVAISVTQEVVVAVVMLVPLLPQAVAETSVTVVAAAVILAALLPRPVMVAALHVENATAAMLLVKESIHRFINTILSRFLKVLVLPKIGRS